MPLFIIMLTVFSTHLQGVQSVSISLSKSKKFEYGQIQNFQTPANDWGDQDVRFLDRHNVRCSGNSAINGFKLQRPSHHTLNYRYNCITNASIRGGEENMSTGWNATANNLKRSMNFLDRHRVYCNGGKVMQSFKLSSQGRSIRYDYSCISARIGSCRNGQTGTNDGGSWQTIFLDRHDIALNSNEALQGFKLETPGHNRINYSWTACTILDPEPPKPKPTPIPKPKPTPIPKKKGKPRKELTTSGPAPAGDDKNWSTRKIKHSTGEIKVIKAPKISWSKIDLIIESVNRSADSKTPSSIKTVKGMFGKKDLLVITQNLLLWFSRSKPNEGKIIDSSGGLLSGVWNILYDDKTKEVKLSNYDEKVGYAPNLLLPGSDPGIVKVAGSKISGKYPNTSVKWGIQYSTDAKSTKRHGKKILDFEKGAYSADEGIFVEYTGTVTNSATGAGIESMTDTDPASGAKGETQYTLTYRIPAARPEIIQEVEFLVRKGKFGPISSAKMNLKLPAYKDKALSYATAPEPQIPNKQLNLGKVQTNKFFKNSCVKDVYFYDVAFQNHKEKLIARLPPGKGQIACLGAPAKENNIPYLCAYPNNDYIPKETYGEYVVEVADNKINDLHHALVYRLLSSPNFTLTFKEKEKLNLIMRYKLIDAKIELESKEPNLKTIKVR